MKTADEILAAEKCGDIFSRGTKESVMLEYRELMKCFHPDLCALENATTITAKLNDLYNRALSLIASGTWEVSNVIELQDTNGKTYRGKYLRSHKFELGVFYVADLSVTYVFDEKHRKFFDNAVTQIKAIHYPNTSMEKEISRYMPHIKYSFVMPDGRSCLIIDKSPDVFLLSDVLGFYGASMPDRHVAWVISRLCNICCYFGYLNIAHNGLTMDMCYISPSHHTILPLGGWWYAKRIGDHMLGTPRSIYDIMSVKAKTEKVSSSTTDLESMRLIGRQLLDKDSAPKVIVDFLNAGSSHTATREFDKWNTTLDLAYNRRQFVEMNLSKLDIYKQ